MSIKKIAILVMIGVGALTTVIVVPIVVLSNKEDQKDPPKNIKIKEIQTSLNNLNLILPKGKDYSDETKILRAIKTALENRTNIDASHTTFITSKASANNKISLVAIHNATPTLFTIVVGDEEFILKLNQAQYTLDERSKINKLKNVLSNLKVTLPKNGNYSNEAQIFKAIKIKLETREGIDALHTAFATSKTSDNSKISSVAIHRAPPTPFIVIVDGEEFILQLNQAQYDADEIAKINELTNSLNNLKLILPKGKDYSDESKVFEAVKTAIKARDGINDSHLAFITSKTLSNNGITLVAIHGATPTPFIVIVNGQEFILQLNQAQYDANEKAEINELANSLNNLKLILPKGGDYSSDSQVFEAIKIALKKRVGIDNSHLAFITSKTLANSSTASVAEHGEMPTQFIVIVDGQEFILKLNQAQYDANEKIKINELKGSLNNLKLILPKGENYSNDSQVFEAIKIALKKRVGIDDSHLAFISSKVVANSIISSVASHGASSTQFIVIVDAQEFVLELNQAEYTIEEIQINKMQASLSDLNLIFPNDGDYSDEIKILEAIKIVLQKREGIDASHTTFITSKTSANSDVSSIAAHEATPTPFTINVGDQEFVLKLKLSPFTSEQIKINELKATFNSNLNMSIPKGKDYSDESKVFEAVKTALKARDGINDSHIAFITSKALANNAISSVAAHGAKPTSFVVIVDGEEFILQLNQVQYDANEKAKIDQLKNSLNDLRVTLPKGEDYTSASNIFEAIKIALKKRVGIDDSHIAFITSKASANNAISSVAAHGATPTSFVIIVNEKEFILQLNQAQYDANEKAKIDQLKNSLNDLRVTLPKGEDYTSSSNIFEAIKIALKKRVGIDDSHIAFITSKASSNSSIALVAAHGATPTSFVIIVDGEEFILQLNQVQYDANEKAKIDQLKNSLSDLKVTLPKGEDYTSASNIFEAIKIALKKRVGIDDSHIAFITSKASSNSSIALIAAHGATPTSFVVIVNQKEFILQLNQAQYDANERLKISQLKASLSDLNVTIPRDPNNYGNHNIHADVFKIIKRALEARVGIDDSHTAFLSIKERKYFEMYFGVVYPVATFAVFLDGQEFILLVTQAP